MKPLHQSRILWASALAAGIAGVCAVLSADPDTPHWVLVAGNCANAFLAAGVAVLRVGDKRRHDTHRAAVRGVP